MAKLEDFVLTNDGFAFRGRQYLDNDVAHISLDLVHADVRAGFVSTGGVDLARLEIRLADGENITVTSKSGFAPLALYFRDKPEERMGVRQAYETLAARTFKTRLNPFIEQVQRLGYFEYNKARFYPDGRLFIKGKQLNAADIQWSRTATYVYANPKKPTLADKLTKGWDGGPHFYVDTDHDVLFFLLHKFFGIKW